LIGLNAVEEAHHKVGTMELNSNAAVEDAAAGYTQVMFDSTECLVIGECWSWSDPQGCLTPLFWFQKFVYARNGFEEVCPSMTLRTIAYGTPL
jgi:hypothetical protein